MSIASEITRLQGVKSDILTAIGNKGVTVPADSALDDCPGLIGDIPTGSSLPTSYAIIGNEVYRTVIIGNTEWLAENLRMTGDWLTIGTTTNNDVPRANYCNSSSYNKNAGLLYNYQAAEYIDDNRETLCPGGWRVPSKSDFETLQSLIGGSDQGLKLIYPYMGWNSNGGTNITMFDGSPMGYFDGSFSDVSTTLYLMSRDTYPNENGRCYGFVIGNTGSTSISYYWQRWEFNIRLCRPYTENIGGNDYKCVKMPDGKVWMAENLDYKWDGLGIGGTTDPGTNQHAWYYNNNEPAFGVNGNKYGLLYNWYATKYLDDNKSTLIPGWHVPTNDELYALQDALGNASGAKLKSTSNWYNNGNGNDMYGFGGVPTGLVNPGNNPMFEYYQKSTTYQCITQYGTNRKYGMSLYENSADAVVSYNFGFPQGNSVRLVKDT